HVDVAAATSGADKPLAPLGNGGLGAVSLGHPGSVGLGPVTARLAPDDEPDTGRSRVAKRHRRTQRGLLPSLSARRVVSAWLLPAVVHIVTAAEALALPRDPSRGATALPCRG